MLQKNKQLSQSILTILGFSFFLWLILNAPQFKKSTEIFLVQEVQVSTPVRLKIPNINVDAPVDHVGITPLGEMDAPKDPDRIGWYMHGPKPGEIGSSVMDGHSGWKNNTRAIFDDLYKLKKGDKIYTEDDRGVVTTFVVRELRTYNPKADAKEVFISTDGIAHLNLITCSGVWNELKKTHSERLIVFSDKV